jgi:hypothetical protein
VTLRLQRAEAIIEIQKKGSSGNRVGDSGG